MAGEKAIAILKQINSEAAIEAEITAIEKETSHEIKNESIFMKKYRKPLFLAFLLHFSINCSELMPSYIVLPEFLNWPDYRNQLLF